MDINGTTGMYIAVFSALFLSVLFLVVVCLKLKKYIIMCYRTTMPNKKTYTPVNIHMLSAIFGLFHFIAGLLILGLFLLSVFANEMYLSIISSLEISDYFLNTGSMKWVYCGLSVIYLILGLSCIIINVKGFYKRTKTYKMCVFNLFVQTFLFIISVATAGIALGIILLVLYPKGSSDVIVIEKRDDEGTR